MDLYWKLLWNAFKNNLLQVIFKYKWWNKRFIIWQHEEFLKVIFGPVGLITKDEDKKLTERGFVAKMPNPKFPLSRYSATEISLFNALDGKEIIKTDYSWSKHFETLSKLPLPLTNGEILEDLFKKFIKNGEDWKDLFK